MSTETIRDVVVTTHQSGDLTFTWADGTVTTARWGAVPIALHSRLARLGWGSKLRDSYALGKGATVAAKKAELVRTVTSLQEGSWTVKSAPVTADDALAVVAALKGITVAELRVELGL